MKSPKLIVLALLALFSFFGAITAKGQETMTFAYASKDAQVTPIGTMRVDTYDVAIALTNPSVYGMTITQIDVPVLVSDQISDLSAWISTSLKLESKGSVKVNVPDISYPLEMPSQGEGVQWMTVTLEEPYTIPEGGAYVGYSFTVNKVTDSNVTKYPVVATTGSEPGSLYLHTTRTYKTWEDRSASLGAVSMLQVTLQGSSIPDNAARLGTIPFKYVAVDAENTISVMVYNVGSKPISTIEYTTLAADKSHNATIELTNPIEATFGYGEEVEFTLPEFTQEGECKVALTINAINGEAVSGVTVRGKVQVALFVPKHNALVEEYTGMWCGNCPRGYVAMEEMAKLYPDFIGIAYHNNDALAMEKGDPGLSDSFPNASIDRVLFCDPYYADPASSTFSLPQVWNKYCEEFTPVEVEVQAQWNEENHSVTATSTINWATVPDDAKTANYRMEYVLVADGLSDPKWYQTNYYADGANGYPEYMDEFTHGQKYVFGLVYNDVAMLTSGFKGVNGSIPSIAVGDKTSHSFTFNADDAYTAGGEHFPYHKDQLRVVALVLKGAGAGTVVNAAKCNVAINDGLTDILSDALEVEYYNLSGIKVSHPQKGIYIKCVKNADGTYSYSKVALR